MTTEMEIEMQTTKGEADPAYWIFLFAAVFGYLGYSVLCWIVDHGI